MKKKGISEKTKLIVLYSLLFTLGGIALFFKVSQLNEQAIERTKSFIIVGSILGETKAIKRLCSDSEPIAYLTAYKNILKEPFKKAQKNIRYYPEHEIKRIIEGFAQSYFVSLEKSFFTFQMNKQHQQQEVTIKEFCDEINKTPIKIIQQKKEYLEEELI